MEREINLMELLDFVSGTPQSRIFESSDNDAPIYMIYSQTDLRSDIHGVVLEGNESKSIRTLNDVNTLSTGDILFSLISGSAVIVSEEHNGYLFTQNYIKLLPKNNLDSKYIVYFLNMNKKIRKQLQSGLQGSTIMKYTLMQLKEIKISSIPSLTIQRNIGEIYFKQLRVQALRYRVANLETVKTMHLLEEEMYK
ncbi:MAG: restriction endonuclease subunit S [Bacilli bacterium]